MDLQALFCSIPDFRRGQGQRYRLPDVLWIIFLAIASGYSGYRAIAKFAKAHEAFFIGQLSLRHGVPSHVTIRQILTGLDKVKLQNCFNAWTNKEDLLAGAFLAGDGKALASTVKNTFGQEQNFSATVSLFAHASGLTYLMADYQNKKQSEAQTLRLLLEQLQQKGLCITLDALHMQKKQ